MAFMSLAMMVLTSFRAFYFFDTLSLAPKPLSNFIIMECILAVSFPLFFLSAFSYSMKRQIKKTPSQMDYNIKD